MMKLKMQLVVLIIMTLFRMINYGQSPAITPKKTIIIDKVETCRSNPNHTYQLFVPSVDQCFKQLPLLISIDSHGDGKLAISGFKEAAQKYHAVVVGSNLIKNNDANFIHELDELIADVKSRYPVGNILFIAGFSGGARMALGYATNHLVNGVIACGALAQKDEITILPGKIVSIIGMDDFNFMEAAPFILNPITIPSNLAIETTKASHSWPEKELLQSALGYLLLPISCSVELIDNKKKIGEYVNLQKRHIDQLVYEDEYIQAVLTARNMYSCPVFEKEFPFKPLIEKLTNESKYKSQIDDLRKNIQFEVKVRNSYYQAITQKDSVWWKSEIDLLNTTINTSGNESARQTYKRIKGFLGIVCFSLCNRFLQEKNLPNLEKVLWVYHSIEPKNPDMMQFSRKLGQLKKNH